MAGRFRQLTLAAVFSAASFIAGPHPGLAAVAPSPSPVLPEHSPTPSPAVPPSPQATAKPAKPPKADEWDEARRLFEQLSPDQKQKFRENLQQWKNMPPEQRDLFRDREVFRREKIAQEIQDAINKSGLRLDDDQREVYALRYAQERRKIEENLRKEMEQKRKNLVNDMLGRLKREFAGNSPAAPAPKPTPTPVPKTTGS